MIICSCCKISDKDTKDQIKIKIKNVKNRCKTCSFFKDKTMSKNKDKTLTSK